MMNSPEHKRTAEVTVKEEKENDVDTAAVFPEYDINIHEADIKQECAQDTSALSKDVSDNTTDPNIQVQLCDETFSKEMTTVMSSQQHSHHFEFKISTDFSIKRENVAVEDTAPVFSGFAIDIQEADIKEECARVSNTDNVNVCGKLAILSSGDINHQLNMMKRSGNKPHGCVQCGKTFSKKNHLTYHENIHSGKKPYSCEQCGKSFSDNRNFLRHSRTHSGKKPYICGICEKTFSEKEYLKAHEMIHSGEKSYRCGQCGKIFLKRGNLKSHERIHSGEKPYCCGQCGKTFSQQGSLIYHELVHTGEKPYSCRTCGKTFSQKGNLRSHERIHSTEKPNS